MYMAVNFMIRAVIGMALIFFINQYVIPPESSINVGLNAVSFLTSGMLGIPVILDLGDCVSGLYDILKKCSRIYTPYIQDEISMAKMRQYEENLKTAGYSDILKRTMKRQMRVK